MLVKWLPFPNLWFIIVSPTLLAIPTGKKKHKKHARSAGNAPMIAVRSPVERLETWTVLNIVGQKKQAIYLSVLWVLATMS